MSFKQRALSLLAVAALAVSSLSAQAEPGNDPKRLEWFRDLGFGLFIHWSLDSQVGSVISHSMVGASDDYLDRFINELPKTFNPKKLDAREWARLAKLAGFTYVVFTTKHHSGFCMFETETTEFNIMNTPYGKDVTREIFDAFRAEGLAIGIYYSPDDFHFLRDQGTLISRRRPEVFPSNNPDLMKYDLAQIRELMTNYGPIDVMFLDGPPEGLKELTWELQPQTIVTRGAMETPEQFTPGLPLEGAWEGNMTMGQQWQYRPTNETYKSGNFLIRTLIETRAKGGNYLLNIGPKPDGELPIEQEGLMREIALWNLVNQEAILKVRPWVITNEGDIWFTKAKDASTVYAFVAGDPWTYAEERKILLKSVKATSSTQASILGQNDKVLEYRPEVTPKTSFEQTSEGLQVTATRAHRLYNDRRWPNPVVIKLTNVEPGLKPPHVTTTEARWEGRKAILSGAIEDMGDQSSMAVGFEWRLKKDMAALYEPDDPWKPLKGKTMSAAGKFSIEAAKLPAGKEIEFRALAAHPVLTVYGAPLTLEAGR